MTMENIFNMQKELAALIQENKRLILQMLKETPLPGFDEHDDQLLDTADVMRFFKKTERTIYTWRMRGLLPFIIYSGTIYFLKSEVYRLLRNQPPKCK